MRSCVAALVAAAALTACDGPATGGSGPGADGDGTELSEPASGSVVTLALAGDVHFERHLRRLLRSPDAGLGPFGAALSGVDVAMVNLESAITQRGRRDPKR